MTEKELKQQNKAKKLANRLEIKRLAKEAKAAHKVQKNADKQKIISQDVQEQLSSTDNRAESKKVKKETKKIIKVKKAKEEKDKVDYKLAFREFPVKMVKEVNKIKWSGWTNLNRKYITVLIFMIIFAIVFYFVDWGLQEIFILMKVV